MTKDKQKANKPLNPFVPLVLMVLACAIVSYFVIPGAYDRETVDGVTRVLADSYHATERTPVSFFNIFRSIPEGLTASANMMFCVMLIGGIVEIYKRTNTVGAAINSVLKASERMSSQVIIAIVMIVFFIFGGILGWSEHIIPFVPIIVSLALSLGYDSLVGMAISGFACLISFAVAPFNVYTVGISHTIAELPMFSGWELRIAALVCVWILSLVWVMRYAKKVKADPSKSLVKDVDTSSLRIPVDPGLKFDLPKKVSVISLTISILVTIYGILNLSWSYTEMAATFMIGGDICTRSCKFCNTQTGRPHPLDANEPTHVAESIALMKLDHAVITSVDRDDLPDLGAEHWARTIREIKRLNPQTTIEVLIPDFQGRMELVDLVIDAGPDIISHNMETVRRISPLVRSAANYDTSLQVIRHISEKGVKSKSGIMVGLGETPEEVETLMDDLLATGCQILTIGQYLQPSHRHYPVVAYITPLQFTKYKTVGLEKGFNIVESAPLVRSSYHAEKHIR